MSENKKSLQQFMQVLSNEKIADGVYKMVLEGDTSAITRPGEFVNISIPGFFLRRPISVNDWTVTEDGATDGRLSLIYKVVGHGTDAMSAMKAGEKLDVLVGLGHGFETGKSGEHPLLVGGGVGTPPMYGLAKRLVQQGKSVDVILGFNRITDVFLVEEFEALNDLYEFGCEGFEGPMPRVRVHVATVSGELGTKGFVTDCIKDVDECTHLYSCGPIPMLKALKGAVKSAFPNAGGELSLEERMGCGFGACVGCSVETASGWRKVCKDGPVFDMNEVL